VFPIHQLRTPFTSCSLLWCSWGR